MKFDFQENKIQKVENQIKNLKFQTKMRKKLNLLNY